MLNHCGLHPTLHPDDNETGEGVMTQTAEQVVEEREATHGDVEEQARISQQIQNTLGSAEHWHSLPYHMQQSLQMIALKMSRIVVGDCFHADSWLDIEGYAHMSRNRIPVPPITVISGDPIR